MTLSSGVVSVSVCVYARGIFMKDGTFMCMVVNGHHWGSLSNGITHNCYHTYHMAIIVVYHKYASRRLYRYVFILKPIQNLLQLWPLNKFVKKCYSYKKNTTPCRKCCLRCAQNRQSSTPYAKTAFPPTKISKTLPIKIPTVRVYFLHPLIHLLSVLRHPNKHF